MDEERVRGVWSEPGLTVGVGAGILFGVVQVYLWRSTAGFHSWLYPLQWLGYLVAGRSAAELKYRAQQDYMDALAGVKLAGTGAALVGSLLVWAILLVYWLGFDLMPLNGVIFRPVAFVVGFCVDVFVAIAAGTYGGSMIAHKYRNFFE